MGEGGVCLFKSYNKHPRESSTAQRGQNKDTCPPRSFQTKQNIQPQIFREKGLIAYRGCSQPLQKWRIVGALHLLLSCQSSAAPPSSTRCKCLINFQCTKIVGSIFSSLVVVLVEGLISGVSYSTICSFKVYFLKDYKQKGSHFLPGYRWHSL